MRNEVAERTAVVRIAQSFIGTPYHSQGRKKGIGVDCLTILCCVYEEAGLIDRVSLPNYAPDFFKHKGTELYLQGLLKYTEEVEVPNPGDIVLWKFGRCFSHAAIVVNWPHVIHAHYGRRVMMENVEAAEWLRFMGESARTTGKIRPTKIFSYWKKDELSSRNTRG